MARSQPSPVQSSAIASSFIEDDQSVLSRQVANANANGEPPRLKLMSTVAKLFNVHDEGKERVRKLEGDAQVPVESYYPVHRTSQALASFRNPGQVSFSHSKWGLCAQVMRQPNSQTGEYPRLRAVLMNISTQLILYVPRDFSGIVRRIDGSGAPITRSDAARDMLAYLRLDDSLRAGPGDDEIILYTTEPVSVRVTGEDPVLSYTEPSAGLF
ncbi:hypothetical protein BC834DRAFT_973006 [Gloeopeniophorella convolvens]|nr:hypothetical protein BC834DRAFT_973006 [Gloeopeniophorella convolvens]